MTSKKTAKEDVVPFGQKLAFGPGHLANQLFPAAMSVFMVTLEDQALGEKPDHCYPSMRLNLNTWEGSCSMELDQEARVPDVTSLLYLRADEQTDGQDIYGRI